MARPRISGGTLKADGTGATGIDVGGDASILDVALIEAAVPLRVAAHAHAAVHGAQFDYADCIIDGTLAVLPGDRAAWDTADVPELHARDISENDYQYHLSADERGELHVPLTLAGDADTLLGLSGQSLSLDPQAANVVFSGPATGAAADPAFRALVDADIPVAVLRDDEHTAIGNSSPHHAPVTLGVGSDPALALSGQELTLTLPADHDPVTLGAGNDAALALSGQELTLTLPPGSAHVIENEGSTLTQRAALNFVGASVDVTDDVGNDATVVTISAGSGGHVIEDEGTSMTARTKLNFVGAGVDVTDDSGDDATVVTIDGGGSGLTQPQVMARISIGF